MSGRCVSQQMFAACDLQLSMVAEICMWVTLSNAGRATSIVGCDMCFWQANLAVLKESILGALHSGACTLMFPTNSLYSGFADAKQSMSMAHSFALCALTESAIWVLTANAPYSCNMCLDVAVAGFYHRHHAAQCRHGQPAASGQPPPTGRVFDSVVAGGCGRIR